MLPSFQTLTLYLYFLKGPHKESPFFQNIFGFLRPVIIYALPVCFPFLSIAKLKCIHGEARGCLWSSSIPLLLSDESCILYKSPRLISPYPLYERVLRLLTSSALVSLARHDVKPRLFRSFWRDLASIHSLKLSPSSSRDAFFCLASFSSLEPAFILCSGHRSNLGRASCSRWKGFQVQPAT